MKATKQFIEDAIKGGWKAPWQAILRADEYTGRPIDYIEEVVLLDPLAWQAVGKTRGWNETTETWWKQNFEDRTTVDTHVFMMHRFIDHLADGITIEEALEKISN